jgi:putative tryptophan/tyrosine transport system substrate-binding protein
MRRREFIRLLGGAVVRVAAGPLLLWSLSAHGQQVERVRQIGVLMAFDETDAMAQSWIASMRQGLQKLGWTEGHNIHINYRWASSNVQTIQQFAKEIVALNPELIVSSSTPTTRALLQETRTIPVVFGNLVDPVGSGLVASLTRPGGNVTGFINLEPSIAGKWIELLKEIAPRVDRIGIPFNPETAPYHEIYLEQFRKAAASLAIEVVAAPVRNGADLEAFIAAQGREPNGGIIPVPDGFMNTARAQIASLATRYRLPAAHFNRTFAEAGGLISYGNDTVDNYRRVAIYVDRILKGERPTELPVQFPVKFELVINLKTAKALGLTVPISMQQLADEVIE